MKTALIPPIPHLEEFGRGSFHLLLAHLVEDQRYFDHYMSERVRGAYLVLDNSAHENGKGENATTLMRKAARLNAQEVVVPDVLDDGEATVEAALKAHEQWFERSYKLAYALNPALMYVPQGSDLEDWLNCFESLVRIHLYASERYGLRRDFVIGLSKDYEKWEGGLSRLLSEFILPTKMLCESSHTTMHVHVLGWGRDSWKLHDIARHHPWIRSTDSAKPFVFAYGGIKLKRGIRSEYPGRTENYFNLQLTEEMLELARHNVELFKWAADGVVE